MKTNLVRAIVAGAITLASMSAHATPVTINISYTILQSNIGTVSIGSGDISGSYLSEFSAGDVIHGTFIYDDDETVGTQTHTSTTSGGNTETEYSYDYTGVAGPYGASVSNLTTSSYNFSGTLYGADVSDNLVVDSIISGEINGKIGTGIYDIYSVFGDTDANGNPDEEWVVAIVADDANWFSDASVFPDSLPASYTALLLGSDFDAMGNEIGRVVLTVDVTVSSVPLPASVWLFGSGLIGLVGVARRKKA